MAIQRQFLCLDHVLSPCFIVHSVSFHPWKTKKPFSALLLRREWLFKTPAGFKTYMDTLHSLEELIHMHIMHMLSAARTVRAAGSLCLLSVVCRIQSSINLNYYKYY